MPRYRIRTEDPNSDEFRVTFISADSQDEAVALVEAKEAKLAATTYTDAELEEAHAAFSDVKAKAGRRPFQQVIHDQSEPYRVVDVVARSQIKSESKAERKG